MYIHMLYKLSQYTFMIYFQIVTIYIHDIISKLVYLLQFFEYSYLTYYYDISVKCFQDLLSVTIYKLKVFKPNIFVKIYWYFFLKICICVTIFNYNYCSLLAYMLSYIDCNRSNLYLIYFHFNESIFKYLKLERML